ncbi:hypothetical protein LEP1GSC008_4292 [Leptospira kirschneri serovar Bulgarica str. Nikolaevo]|uniref:Uncharacterized protein n=1 Tax=Leptospira kirschneri serovar Bulgarica str. Nikolaevo TaxID=1240687 RepID=M6FFD8_9LEPT|nr:hypothetical protein LEP1GSC008_4292 [Leptospira kirschneri serovar Bulgarica str. Nikolaevo]
MHKIETDGELIFQQFYYKRILKYYKSYTTVPVGTTTLN